MNGFISASIESKEDYIDENGIPQQGGKVEWTDPIKCKYYPNEYNNKGSYVDGEFTKVAFEITTSKMDFKADRIRLYDNEMNLIHEDKPKSVLKLSKVRRVKVSL